VARAAADAIANARAETPLSLQERQAQPELREAIRAAS